MTNQGLHADTQVYFDRNDVYHTFASAEDFSGQILEYLIPRVKNKVIIDFGCGTGKYTKCLAPYAKQIYAIDASSNQVSTTQQHTLQYSHISYHTIVDGILPANDATCLIACRVLGTIKDVVQREIIFTNIIQSLKPGTTIYFIENDCTGEFEEVRGKTTDSHKPTKTYNQRLLDHGCTVAKTIDTYFQFITSQEAKTVFTTIRGENIGKKITSSRIEHKVIIYMYEV